MNRTDALVGVYAEQTIQPTRLLGLNAGARIDYVEHVRTKVSPRVAATLEAWRGGTLRVIYAEAFRAPTWEESTSQSSTQIPAEALLPETVRSVEASLHQKLGSDTLFFGVFRSWWTDLVELHVLSQAELEQAQRERKLDLMVPGATQYRNIASIDNWGLNGGYEGSLGHGRFRYVLNVTEAIARRPGPAGAAVPLVVAPQVFGNARAAYAFGGKWPTVGLAVRYLGKRPSDRAFGAGFEPAPFAAPLAEIRLTLTGVVPGIKALNYRLSGSHLTTDGGAYVVGPIQQTQAPTRAELIPTQQWQALAGLGMDF